MNKEKIKEYQELELKKKEIEERQSQIKSVILLEMTKEDIDRVDSEYGSFTVVERKGYTYSDNVLKAEQNVKDLKKEEEQSGIAQLEIKKSLTFYQVKNK